MNLIRRMLFPDKETYKNTLAFDLFRVRFEIGNPGPVPHRLSRMPSIRRMLFPDKETYKNTLAFDLFRVRYEMRESRSSPSPSSRYAFEPGSSDFCFMTNPGTD